MVQKTRKYEQSHPWITFHVDLRKVEAKTWVLLGEVQSKCLHISKAPLKPELRELLHRTYLAKGIHGTTAIEGNTLTENQVQRRIEGKLELPESQEYQGREIDNILKGYNFVRERLLAGDTDKLSVDEIQRYNSMILKDLPLEDHVKPGELRKVDVGVLRYKGAPFQDCEYLLFRMCQWLNDDLFRPEENRIAFSIIRAILAHLYLAWIHPFGDGNGRTARLIELKFMLASGAPVPACHLLSNHYNKTRGEYYRQLDHASKSGRDVHEFIAYAVRGLVDELQGQLDFIHSQQFVIFWQDLVYEKFGPNPGSVATRKRQIALDLINHADMPMNLKGIPEISTKVAAMYGKTGSRTVERHLADLIEMGLVKMVAGGYIANVETLSQFLPDSRSE